MILYSFVIPVYNVGNYLEKCLDSVLNQSYKNWEAILVDDGSTDKISAKLCDYYSQKDSRIHAYHNKNKGSLMARRFGLMQAVGEYILFVDSDDYIHKDLLLKVNKIITQNQCDLVIFRLKVIGRLKAIDSPIIFKEGTIIGNNGISMEFMWKKVIGSSELNTLYSKVIKRDNIDFEVDYSPYAFLRSGTDLIQSLPILKNAKKIYFTEEVLYYYQYNPDGISCSKRKQTTSNNIERQIESWNALQELRLKYLNQLNYATADNLQHFYTFCFESLTRMLIYWLENESNKENRNWLIQKTMDNKMISEGRKYIQIKDINRKYRLIYKLIIKKSKKVKIPLTIYAIERKVYDILCDYLILYRQIIKIPKR